MMVQISKGLQKGGVKNHGSLLSMLQRNFTPQGIEVAARYLAEKRIQTAPVYLRTWRNLMLRTMTPTSLALEHVDLAVRSLQRKQATTVIKQAPELRLECMARDLATADMQPVLSGGALWPLWMLVLSCLLMLRGISARSLLLEQVKINNEFRQLEVEMRQRKNRHDGRAHDVVLICTCGRTTICAFCLMSKYLELRSCRPGRHVFINNDAKAVSRTAHAKMCQRMVAFAKNEGATPRPHSCRITGSRYWVRMGLSLQTVAVIGCWSNLEVLKHYVGAALLSRRMKRELEDEAGRSGFKSANNLDEIMKEVLERLSNVKEMIVRQEKKRESEGARVVEREPDVSAILAIVRCDRQPMRWHRIKCTSGSITGWSTFCGELFNVQTMSVRPWAKQNVNDPICSKCKKWSNDGFGIQCRWRDFGALEPS